MKLHIETSGLVGDRLFINDVDGTTVAEVQVLAHEAAPLIVEAVNSDLLQELALKLDLANMELTTIDEVLARRPVLAGLKHRTEKIERTCYVNSELLKAAQSAQQHMIGLKAYLATCATKVIVENLETTIAALRMKAEELEAAIRKAKGK